MATVIDLILKSGKTGVDLALYTLLPVMVVMMAFMRTLEERGVLERFAKLLAPLLRPFGLPGLGAFAILQVLFVSFAAPITTFQIIEQDQKVQGKMRAAALATVITMSQGNAVFPLVVVGLNFPVVIMTSLVGGLLAGFIAFKITKISDEPDEGETNNSLQEKPKVKRNIIQSLFAGGEEGLQIAIKAIPPLVLSIFLVNILRETGAILLLERALSPLLVKSGIPGIAVLPIATKYLAGGTAMMAITMDLVKEGALSAVELNRIAGFGLNPFDPIAIALYTSAGPRMAKVIRPAIVASLIGIVFRGILHLIIF